MNMMAMLYVVLTSFISLESKSGVTAFRTTTVRLSSPLPQHIEAIDAIHHATQLLMSSSSSSNKKEGKGSGKSKANGKSKKKNTATDTLFLLKELDEKIDSYEGRLPSKMADTEQTAIEHNESVEQSQHQHQQHRCGFVGIIGAPNMGKSTLLNALLKEDLCIATRRPQTTRHAILGVMSSPTRQCCLLDTPGVLEGDGAYKLQANMMEAVKGALKDSDVFLVVTDMFSTPIPNDEIFRRLSNSQKPVVVAVNKIDLEGRAQRPVETPKDEASENQIDDEEHEEIEKTYTVAEAVAKWRVLLPNALAVIPMTATSDAASDEESSALGTDEHPGVSLLRQILVGSGKDEKEDIPALVRALGRPVPGMFRSGVRCLTNEDTRNLLPVGPPLYDDEFLSDRSVRFFCSELIREALLESRYLKKELPYCCEVQITQYREPRKENEITRIEATIFVERNGQKAIVVGKNGDVIKQVGIIARQKIERFLDGEKVFLKLQVKVDKDWRKKDDALAKFGYTS
jgi:GTP-binding protein Era